jgi:hypothetical protein
LGRCLGLVAALGLVLRSGRGGLVAPTAMNFQMV